MNKKNILTIDNVFSCLFIHSFYLFIYVFAIDITISNISSSIAPDNDDNVSRKTYEREKKRKKKR